MILIIYVDDLVLMDRVAVENQILDGISSIKAPMFDANRISK